MIAMVIAGTELRRLLRDRSNLFFVFVFPLLLVVLIGSAFGTGGDTRLGVAAPVQAAPLLDELDALAEVVVVPVEDVDRLRERVARGGLAGGLVVPDGWDPAALDTGEALTFISRGDGSGAGVRALVEAVLGERSAVLDAARAAEDVDPGGAAGHRDLAVQLQGQIPGVEVQVDGIGGDEFGREWADLGRFDHGASSQLFLFTFLTSLTASGAIIQSRQLGVTRRMLSTPTTTGGVLVGFGAGRLLIALLQAGYIVAATVVLFGVDWGDPVATTAVVVAFSLVGAAAGMLLGAAAANDSQAAGIGLGLALGTAALGGSMMPLELFPPVLRTAANLTPHAWANEAMAEIVRRDGGLADVVLEVGVLLTAAAAIFVLASWWLRRTLVR
jgi:ABC-2 type transport system permease protein